MAEKASIGGQNEPSQGHVDVPGGRLHYLDWGGDGLPAHFLHGNGFCAGTYAPSCACSPPICASPRATSAVTGSPAFERMPPIRHWKVFAEDLALLVTRALGGPVVGMGHSLGAVATTMAAAVRPELFPALVLVDPVFFEPLRLWRVAALRMLGLRGHSPLAVQARRRRRVFKGKAELMRVFAARPGAFKSWAPEFIDAYLECGLPGAGRPDRGAALRPGAGGPDLRVRAGRRVGVHQTPPLPGAGAPGSAVGGVHGRGLRCA
ncbi:MAG: alpha/beta hydrolase [Desulfobacterales bacterium]|nr:alpha/beta hydrolase [Desulfobacterales bacterium]